MSDLVLIPIKGQRQKKDEELSYLRKKKIKKSRNEASLQPHNCGLFIFLNF